MQDEDIHISSGFDALKYGTFKNSSISARVESFRAEVCFGAGSLSPDINGVED
jgi:hypothetical protein